MFGMDDHSEKDLLISFLLSQELGTIAIHNDWFMRLKRQLT